MQFPRAILMGDPEHFFIRSGSNPHTRTRWGIRKIVDSARAKKQWHHLARLFTQLGVRVVVLPPSRMNPGSVFPANAGLLYPKEGTAREKRFYLSNLTPGREAERPLYRIFLNRLGFKTADVPYRFEGEADFIETKSGFLFTWGPIVQQRFMPRFGFPPYQRIYGFRSDARNLEFLRQIAGGKKVLPLRLTNELFYHGDTLLSPFGPEGEYLLAYLPALAPESQKELLSLFGEKLIALSHEDAGRFAANGFQVEINGLLHFILPEGVSDHLLQTIGRMGVKVLTADVSEFSNKGGGSVKCLLCDLGCMDLEGGVVSGEERNFWEERSYSRLYP